MGLENLKNFKEELGNPVRKEQFKCELAFVSFAFLVSYLCTRILDKAQFSPAECLAAGLSSLVLNHLVDAAAIAVFKGTYTKNGIIRSGMIGSITSLAISVSNRILSKIMPAAVTNGSYSSLIIIYGSAFPITFRQFK